MSSSGNRTILQPRSRLSIGANRKSQSGFLQSPKQGQAKSYPQYAQPLPLQGRTMEEQQRINSAVTRREENELLVWTSLDRNESLPQAKLHYERDMLFISSDIEDEVDDKDDDDDDDESGGSGSIEWEETLDWDEDDHQRMKPGVTFGPSGWWDPKVHNSVEERLEAERQARLKENARSGKVKVKIEYGGERSSYQSPQNRRKSSGYGNNSPSSGSTPGRRRASGGKRAFGAGSSSQG